MNKKKFLVNSILLVATALIIRSMGLAFRVYMSNTIGAEGIGLYQLILTVYMFFASVTTAGISLFVTRLVTDYLARGENGIAKRCVTLCLIISVGISTAFGIMMFAFSNELGSVFLGDSRTVLSIKILAPSLPFMAVSACLRGYFLARRSVITTSFEQLLEQLAEIAVFAILVCKLAPMGLEYACCSIVIGTTGAEIISCIYSYILYRISISKIKGKAKRVPHFLNKFTSIALPVTGSSCLRSGLSAIENSLIPAGLRKNGSNYTNALSTYGTISGMVMPIITFPAIFIMPLSTLIIPEISQAKAQNKENSVRRISERLFRIGLLYSIPVMAIMIFLSNELGTVIYNSSDVGIYIAILAPVIPLMYLDSVVDGILKGLNEQVSYLIFNFIDSVIRVILTYFLLPIMGIKGFIIVIFVSELLNTSLSIWRFLKVVQLRLKIFEWIIRPLLCVALPCLLIIMLPFKQNSILGLIIKILLSCIGYILLLYITRRNDKRFSVQKLRIE